MVELQQHDEVLVCCRKRPFLIRPLENTLIKLLKSLDFYDELGRDKIAIGEQPQHITRPCVPSPAKLDRPTCLSTCLFQERQTGPTRRTACVPCQSRLPRREGSIPVRLSLLHECLSVSPHLYIRQHTKSSQAVSSARNAKLRWCALIQQ